MEMTMNMKGRIVEVYEDGLPSFKVETKIGFAFVWVYEEIFVDFRVGMEFHADELPVTFSDGHVIGTVKPGVIFWLEGLCYEVRDPNRVY